MRDEIKMILRKIKDDRFDREYNLITDGYLSSFDMLRLVAQVEDHFGITIPIKDIEPGNFNSIDQICLLITTLKEGGSEK